jgi:hypothetical protein
LAKLRVLADCSICAGLPACVHAAVDAADQLDHVLDAKVIAAVGVSSGHACVSIFLSVVCASAAGLLYHQPPSADMLLGCGVINASHSS